MVAAPVGEALGWLPIGPADGDRRRDAEPRPRLRGDGRRAPDARALRRADGRAPEGRHRHGAPGGGRIPDRADPRAPGADRARHRRAHAGGDRRLHPRRVAHGRGRAAPGARSASTSSSSRRPPGAALPRRPGRARCPVLPLVGPLPLPAPQPTRRAGPRGASSPARRGRRSSAARAGVRGGRRTDGGRRATPAVSWRSAGSSRGARAGCGSWARIRAHRAESRRARRRGRPRSSGSGGTRGPGAEGLAPLLERAAALANHGALLRGARAARAGLVPRGGARRGRRSRG